MPKVQAVPPALRPYISHGVRLDWSDSRSQATGDCPFCGREGKFSVEVATGVWRCFVCDAGAPKEGKPVHGGNDIWFLRLLWESSSLPEADARALAQDRRLSSWETLRDWGVVRSATTGDWLVPGFAPNGSLIQLYRYRSDPLTGKRRLLATAGMDHGLFGVQNFLAKRDRVEVCEGPWDGMALYESVRTVGGQRARTNIVAIPGVYGWKETWWSLLKGKNVIIYFDNDHPRPYCQRCKKSWNGGESGNTCPSCGTTPMSRATPVAYEALKTLVSSAPVTSQGGPTSISYMHWGDNGYDPDLPSGTDVRDLLTGKAASGGVGVADRLSALDSSVKPVPEEWSRKVSAAPRTGSAPLLEPFPCHDWKTLETAFRKAMKWTEGLGRALASMLATITSTQMVGDQIWLKVIGPPSCGKTKLCEALAVGRRHVECKSIIRGFHSGFRSDREGKEDNSLIAKLYGKTLITKDGDTLLQMPNLGQILSEARDLYDCTSRTHYRNKMGKEYEGVRMTWILCGTESLRALDSSELGERFLDCVIADKVEDDLESDIAWRVANQAEREVNMLADGKPETRESPEYTLAKRLAGGYVEYLRDNAADLLPSVDFPEEALRRCTQLGKFVAYMRARPSKRQEETVQRELCYRLVAQHVRLAKCLAVVLNRNSVDDVVMDWTTAATLDTARGRSLDLLRRLYEVGHQGIELRALAVYTSGVEEKERNMLRFLARIGVVEVYRYQSSSVTASYRWRLTPLLARLYAEITDQPLPAGYGFR